MTREPFSGLKSMIWKWTIFPKTAGCPAAAGLCTNLEKQIPAHWHDEQIYIPSKSGQEKKVKLPENGKRPAEEWHIYAGAGNERR